WRTLHLQRRLSVRARQEPHYLDQSERAVVRRRRHQQRLPAKSGLRQQQPVFLRSTLQLPRPAYVLHTAPLPLGTVSSHLYTLEVDEQRWREFLQLADRSVRSRQGLGAL